MYKQSPLIAKRVEQGVMTGLFYYVVHDTAVKSIEAALRRDVHSEDLGNRECEVAVAWNEVELVQHFAIKENAL